MNPLNNSENYTLVTGASSGIGKAIAKEFAERSHNLVLVARNKKVLEELANQWSTYYKINILVVSINLQEENAAKSIYEWCQTRNIKVDALINNAGTGLFGAFDKLSIDEQINMIALNVNSLVRLAYYFVPDLKKHKKGYILNVASIAAFYPLPYYSVYGATKAFVLSFTEALRHELRHSTITVSCLCPGDTNTNFFNNAGNTNKKRSLMSPKSVAKVAVDSLFDNKSVIFPGNMKLVSKVPRFILKKIIARRVSKYKL